MLHPSVFVWRVFVLKYGKGGQRRPPYGLLIFDFLICGRLEKLGILQKLAQKTDGLGIVVSVGKALVDGEAEV